MSLSPIQNRNLTTMNDIDNQNCHHGHHDDDPVIVVGSPSPVNNIGCTDNYNVAQQSSPMMLKRKLSNNNDISRLQTFSVCSDIDDDDDDNNDDEFYPFSLDDTDHSLDIPSNKRQKMMTTTTTTLVDNSNNQSMYALVTPDEVRTTVDIVDPKLSLYTDNDINDNHKSGPTKLPAEFYESDPLKPFALNGDDDEEEEGLDFDFHNFDPSDLDMLVGDLDSVLQQDFDTEQYLKEGQVYQCLQHITPLPDSLQPVVWLLLTLESSMESNNESIVKEASTIVTETMKSYQPGQNDREICGAIFESLVSNIGSKVDLATLFEASAKSGFGDDPIIVETFFRKGTSVKPSTTAKAPTTKEYIVKAPAVRNAKPKFNPTMLQLAIAYGARNAHKIKSQNDTGLEQFVIGGSNKLENMSTLQKEDLWRKLSKDSSSNKKKKIARR